MVGGGRAGAAAAIALARGGDRPLLLERHTVAPEKVCGEFLADDAARALHALGLDLAGLGAVPIRRAIFGAGARQAEMALPFAAWGLPRAALDAALLDLARGAGAEILLGTAVQGAEPAGEGWRLRLANGAVLDAANLVLATGKHELRGLRRPDGVAALGLKLPLSGEVPDAMIALLACAGGYAGLQPRPGGGANLCAALDPRAPGVPEAAHSAAAFLANIAAGSAAAERLLRDLRPALARPMAVAGVRYGFLHRGSGPFRIGDQLSVMPSFCGDGVAMALASGLGAAESIRAGHSATAHHAAWARRVGGAMRLAGAMARLQQHAPWLLVAGITHVPRVATWAARRTRVR
jgi:flavin-dependent dehydrogenase